MLKRSMFVVVVVVSAVSARAGLDTAQTIRDAEALRRSRVLAVAPSSRPGPRGFVIAVRYSAKAAAALVSRREAVTVWASWFGDPSSIGRRHADQVGQIDLGHERVTLSGAATSLIVSGRGFVEPRLAWIRGREVEVNVNVFSARRSGPDNILDCSFFQGPLAEARSKSIGLACKLLDERKM